MHFITAAAGALLLAAANGNPVVKPPPGTDYVTISAATIQYNNHGGVDVFLMKLSGSEYVFGKEGYCYDNQVEWPNPQDVTTCSDRNFAYDLHPAGNKQTLLVRFFHTLKEGTGRWGQGYLPLHCRPDSLTCDLWGDEVIVILKDGDPPNSP